MTRHVRLTIALLAWGCGGGAAQHTSPLWARPGFEGAVRPEMGPPQPGDAAPDFDLPVTGKEPERYRLSAHRGRWVVVHFTTTWCPFCDEEVEHLDRLAGDYASRGVDAVLIDVLEDPAHWREYLHGRLPLGKAVPLSDTDGAVARRYSPPYFASTFEERANTVLASTLIVDPAGTIQLFLLPDSRRFDPTFAAVRTRLDELLAERTPAPVPAASASDAVPGGLAALSGDRVVSPAVQNLGTLHPGATGELRVTLSIAQGYHVMANPASQSNYIPTTVVVLGDGLRFDAPVYPAPSRFRLGEEDIDTLDGETTIRVPFHVADDASPGPHVGRCEIRYQACTEGSCLFPSEKAIEFAWSVSPAQ